MSFDVSTWHYRHLFLLDRIVINMGCAEKAEKTCACQLHLIPHVLQGAIACTDKFLLYKREGVQRNVADVRDCC